MNIKTLKQLAALRQQIEDTEAEIAEWTTRRTTALQQQAQSAQAECVQAFAAHFEQDDDFEVEAFEDGAAARYKTLEISLVPLQDNSPDLMKLRIAGVFEIDTYHEISLAPPDVTTNAPTPTPGGDSDMARLAQTLRELRIGLSQLRKEVSKIEDGHLAFVVRGVTQKTRDNDGSKRFDSFQAYLRSTFDLNGVA